MRYPQIHNKKFNQNKKWVKGKSEEEDEKEKLIIIRLSISLSFHNNFRFQGQAFIQILWYDRIQGNI